MWNFIKCVFKFVFSLVAITTLVAGVGVVAFAYIFKKILKILKEKLKKLFLISKVKITFRQGQYRLFLPLIMFKALR